MQSAGALTFDSTFSLAGPTTISGSGAVTFAGNALSATPGFTFTSGEGAVLQVNGTPTVTVGGDIVNVAAGLPVKNVTNPILAQTGGSVTAAGSALSLGTNASFVTNLVSNALKYAPGASEVLVSAAARGEEVAITVRDAGLGIAPEDLPRVFERFYRGKTTQKADGLGLGLFIVRLLVEAHGGRVWAESNPGEGAAFTFTLPTPQA